MKPLDSVGCYVPGGRYPLISTVLMTVIPAQVAGVKNIQVVSPKPAPAVLGAAAMLGVSEFYRIGGAHAIAALAYGTAVDSASAKNRWPRQRVCNCSKKLVAFDCAIDFLAGPTEALIVSDSGKPDFIAADLVAQAEHDIDAFVLFITSSRKLAQEVSLAVKRIANGNSTAEASLKNMQPSSWPNPEPRPASGQTVSRRNTSPRTKGMQPSLKTQARYSWEIIPRRRLAITLLVPTMSFLRSGRRDFAEVSASWIL